MVVYARPATEGTAGTAPHQCCQPRRNQRFCAAAISNRLERPLTLSVDHWAVVSCALCVLANCIHRSPIAPMVVSVAQRNHA